MKPSESFLIQAASASTKELKDIVTDAGGKVVNIAAQAACAVEQSEHGDVIALVDEATLAKLKATKALQVRPVEWRGSMADPGGEPTDQSLYPGHMPLSKNQVARLQKDAARLYRVRGLSEDRFQTIADGLPAGASVELVKVAGKLHDQQRELTIKANDQGILGLLAKNGSQVSIC